MSDRLTSARDYVAKKPTDRFGLYALAMELRKLRTWDECFATFDTLLTHHANYGAAYFHYGMARRESGDRDGAKSTWEAGLEKVRSTDSKTAAELQGALDDLENE